MSNNAFFLLVSTTECMSDIANVYTMTEILHTLEAKYEVDRVKVAMTATGQRREVV